MNDDQHLHDLAFQREHQASRRLAARDGLSHTEALRQTLEQRAGAAGLSVLLDARRALSRAAAQRQADREAARAAARERHQSRHLGPHTPWRAWFDGSAHPNPGRCAIGAVLKGPGGEHIEIALPAGYGNNGEAEYRALLAVLEVAVTRGAFPLTVYGDSQVVINDVNAHGPRGIRALHAYRQAARALLAQLPGATLRWVPRHKNSEADALSQRAAGEAFLAEVR